jgi:fatty-acyl-CoA synthase
MTVPLLETSLGDTLRASAARFPDRPALAWAVGDVLETMDYRSMLAECEKIAFWLLDQARPGDCIVVWSRNTVEWALLEFGCALAGVAIAAWNPGWTDFECSHALALTNPALVLAECDTRGHSLVERAQAVASGTPFFRLDVMRDLAISARPCELPAVTPDDLLLIQFTSGTTGRAKAASLSHRSVVNAGWLRAALTGTDETDVYVNPAPLSHIGGSVTLLPGAIMMGALYVVMHRFEAGEMLRMMKLARATRTGGVPTMLVALLDHPDFVAGSIELRSVGAGGAQVPQPLIERLMHDFGAPVLVSYAQSEHPIITSSTLDDTPQMLAETVGKVVPHVTAKVIDRATGRTLGPGEIGEICVRSAIAMQGYYNAPETTSETIDTDGFVHTGDLGTMDAQGYLRIQGRARDVVIRGGENIYPAEVEDALLSHPAVAQVAVVGVPDERWGQQVGAAVQFREGMSATVLDLEAYAGSRIAHFKIPRIWRVVDSFPQTPNGKIAKVEVEKLLVEPNQQEAVS